MSNAKKPKHIAFIMDGNGRWARRQSLMRLRGHEQGATTLREITEHCCAEGLEQITFYALSTENYRRRPQRELKGLMRLLKRYLIDERETIRKNNIRLRTIGRTAELPDDIKEEMRITLDESAGNTGMVLRLALNYGGRQEILDAVAAVAKAVEDSELNSEDVAQFEEKDLARFLYDPEMTDPDLLIRTAGEFRMSNFLLWQLSYSELYIADVTWPEFTIEHLTAAIAAYGDRERKFGSLSVTGAATQPGDGIA